MKKKHWCFLLFTVALVFSGCSTAYKPKPIPIKHPSAFNNMVEVENAVLGARAFVKRDEAKDLFGFDVLGAGLLPVQIVMENKGGEFFTIVPGQTFLQDNDKNLWPVLSDEFAYERVTKYTTTNKIFKEGSYKGFIAGTAGAILGAAVGIVSGENVGEAVGKGAAIGFSAGAALGGADAAASEESVYARVMEDFNNKDLKNKSFQPNSISYGFIFFPGESKSAEELILQLKDPDTQKVYTFHIQL